MKRWVGRFAAVLVLLLVAHRAALFPAAAAEDQPICTIAAISNPYLTAASAKELGPKRRFLAKTAPAGLQRAIAAVNRLKPDALVVLGSLTWTGSDADFALVKAALSKVEVPWYVTPGERDLAEGGAKRFAKYFAKPRDVLGTSLEIRGVHLYFAPSVPRGAKTDAKAVESLKAKLPQRDAKAVLLFGGPDFPFPKDAKTATPSQREYWNLIQRRKVAARFVGGHSHTVRYEGSLPIWSIPSSGWSYTPKWELALISVFVKHIDLTLVRDPFQPVQRLTIPNPLGAKRMATAADDPYGLPTYSQDLARKPDLTFAQLSDSQFDDGSVPRYGARYIYDEPMNELAVTQVNRLNPAMVFMTGDLTNKNTPAEWKTFQRIYSQLKPPLHAMPGNHDTLYDRTKLDRKTLGDLFDSGVKNWKLADELAGEKTPDRTALYRHFTKQKPYYSVEKSGCVFLCLNTGVASVDAEQMKWLRRELERTKDAKHVFVLGHYPVLSDFGGNVQGPESREILLLLRKYKVAAYLSGHRHRYDYRMHDGVMHILCDCLCWGEYRSFQIYHVFPDRIVACWKPIFRADGNRPLYERVVFGEPRHRESE